MTSYPSPPGIVPRRGQAPRPAAPKRTRWGWLEWFLVVQLLMPGLLFIPGMSAIRVVTRVGVFMLPLLCWAMIVRSGRSRSGADSFPANLWLKLVIGLLSLLILHWDTNSPQAGLAHAMFYIAVISPAFWAPRVIESPGQIGRMMMILLACNGLSAVVGLGQVFRPTTFNPPVIPGVTDAATDSIGFLSVSYEDKDGNRIVRPCGLGDQVGGAALAGAGAALAGLAFALRPIGGLRRLAAAGLAFCGVATIYYSQVRMTLMMLVICIAVLVVIFILQRNFGHAALLGGLGAAMVLGALSWVIATSGREVVERFIGLTTTNFSENYEKSGRSGMVRHVLETLMWENPLGVGLGRWGTIYGVFGDKSRPGVWVEVMLPAWVVDGGIPLLAFYGLAIGCAMADALRIALRSRDRDLRFWGAVIFASNLSVIATCFSYVTFFSLAGVQFWLMAAALHAADIRVREAAAARPKPRPTGSVPVAPGRHSP